MKLIADVYVTTPKLAALKRCFDAEIQSMQTLRSTVAVHTTNDTIHFAVAAKDSTALRATLNTITKLLTVFEKAAGDNNEQ
jgi:tRNA threonylcarbamoyladenosine modification (KEOPS) complex  Pcc1 subunit